MRRQIFKISHATVVLISLTLAGTAFSQSTIDVEPPTAPINLNAVAVSDNEVRLSWEPATDNHRVVIYEVSRNNQLLATSEDTSFTDSRVQAGAFYTYQVVASDGVNVSKPAVFSLSTLATGESLVPGARPSVADGEITSAPTASGAGSPVYGVPAGWQVVFNDDFTGNGALDVSSPMRNWRYETMSDGLHRAGNTGIDANGNIINSLNSVNGKRWSAWYNDFNSENAYRSNDMLIMAGHDSGELDLTRQVDYLDNGTRTSFGASRLYTSWIDTFSRIYVDPIVGHIVDPASPAKSFKYGYIEISVSFEEMTTPGFRFSVWLMPASSDAAGQNLLMGSAYDADGNNGVEIDIFEYEWINPANASRIQAALIGGAAGSQHISLDTATLGMNLSQGFQTIGLLWQADRIEWHINGQLLMQVTDPDLIPDIFSYLILSREINSGVKRPGIDNVDSTDMIEQLPFVPRDPGLFANNVWEFRDRFRTDQAKVDFIRIWQP